MPSPTWTPAELYSESRPAAGLYWRMVEAQHITGTLDLVDSLEEQALLEALLEESKPPVPAECGELHYLLASPFRYGAVYPQGSRFRRAGRTPGVLYLSASVTTAAAEMAFYRLLFYAESPATPWPAGSAEFTAFAVAVHTERSIDLTQPPLNEAADAWCDLTHYSACQALAQAARSADLDAITYASVRDPGGGSNLAVLRCRAIAVPVPQQFHSWRFKLGRSGVQAIREHPRMAMGFGRSDFHADPRLQSLNWER